MNKEYLGFGAGYAMKHLNRDPNVGGQGGGNDLEKEAALKVVRDTARDTAEYIFAQKAKEFVKYDPNSDEAKALIKTLAEEALLTLKIKEADGKETAITELFKEFQAQHDALSTKVKGLTTDIKEAEKSWEVQIKEALKIHEASLKSMHAEGMKSAGVSFDMKVAGTITIAGNYSGGTVGLTSWDNEFTRIQRRKPFMRELVRVIPTNNMYIAWAEQANADPGVAGTVAEGAAKPQSDFDIVERSAKVEKIATFIKASKESLADLGYLSNEINTELRELVELLLDAQILAGNGNTPNLKGILQYAPAFTGGGQVVSTANRYDVIVAAIAQVVASNFMPDTVVLNPVDFYGMMLTKDSEGRYLIPPFLSSDRLNILGLRVVANNGVTSGSYLVGDMKKDNLAMREEFNIQIGYVNDDFTKNLVTILAELRAVNYIKTNHINAFVQGTFIASEWLIEATT